MGRFEVSYWIDDNHICTIPQGPVPGVGTKIKLKPIGSEAREIISKKEASAIKFDYFVVDKIDVVILFYPGDNVVQEHQVHLISYK
jgi:hypothetical protein